MVKAADRQDSMTNVTNLENESDEQEDIKKNPGEDFKEDSIIAGENVNVKGDETENERELKNESSKLEVEKKISGEYAKEDTIVEEDDKTEENEVKSKVEMKHQDKMLGLKQIHLVRQNGSADKGREGVSSNKKHKSKTKSFTAKNVGLMVDIRKYYTSKTDRKVDGNHSLRGKVTQREGDINTNVLGPYENN